MGCVKTSVASNESGLSVSVTKAPSIQRVAGKLAWFSRSTIRVSVSMIGGRDVDCGK